ncbi:hypothetical protein YC2023_117014 [Brassica napus]
MTLIPSESDVVFFCHDWFSLFRLLMFSSHSVWKVVCFLDSRVKTSPVFGSQR